MMPERSKGVDLSSTEEIRAGSNPAHDTKHHILYS